MGGVRFDACLLEVELRFVDYESELNGAIAGTHEGLGMAVRTKRHMAVLS